MFPEGLEHLGRLALVLLVAIVCGGVLGGEREYRRHRAGLRTIVLICLGSALFVFAGVLLSEREGWPGAVRIDPGRIASYVVAGIGFLGAGPIIRRELGPEGLTTAATIWAGAAIGMLAGFELHWAALGTTLVAILVLRGLAPVSELLGGGRIERTMRLEIADSALVRARVEHALRGSRMVRSFDDAPGADGHRTVTFTYRGTHADAADLLTLVESIAEQHREMGPIGRG